jgi:predicted phosphoribosyltransferase
VDAPFRDRREAGRFLARKLGHLAGRDVVVLALPRGGVPVAYEIAKALEAPLDVFTVRKLGVPIYEELAMGAIASGGIRVLNEDVIRELGITQPMIDVVMAEEERELQRREAEYRRERDPLEVAGRLAILVDDGLATGASMRAAVSALRQKGAASIIVAVPVRPAGMCAQLRNEADEIVCGKRPEELGAVGRWYEDFQQTTDQEVCELLGQAALVNH